MSRHIAAAKQQVSSLRRANTSVLKDVTTKFGGDLKESLRNCRHDFISDFVEQADPLAPLAINNTCTIIDEDPPMMILKVCPEKTCLDREDLN